MCVCVCSLFFLLFSPLVPSAEELSLAGEVVNSLSVLEVVAPAVSPRLKPHLFSLLPLLLSSLLSQFAVVRHMAACSLTVMAKVDLHQLMQVHTYVHVRTWSMLIHVYCTGTFHSCVPKMYIRTFVYLL